MIGTWRKKQCHTQSFKPVSLLLQAFGVWALCWALPYLLGGHFSVSFTWCALSEWWLLQSCLVGCHHPKGQRDLPLENIYECSLFPFHSRPQSLSATHGGKLGKVRKGRWIPGWTHYMKPLHPNGQKATWNCGGRDIKYLWNRAG